MRSEKNTTLSRDLRETPYAGHGLVKFIIVDHEPGSLQYHPQSHEFSMHLLLPPRGSRACPRCHAAERTRSKVFPGRFYRDSCGGSHRGAGHVGQRFFSENTVDRSYSMQKELNITEGVMSRAIETVGYGSLSDNSVDEVFFVGRLRYKSDYPPNIAFLGGSGHTNSMVFTRHG